MGYQLGVDLGTTFTAAAVARGGRAEPVSLGTNSMVVPSVVYLGDGGFIVGDAAQRRTATDPSRVAREFKRRVGDPTPILIGASPVAADLLMARLLAWVVGEVSGWEGGPPDALAVTHPANWGLYKLDLFTQAIRHVGLHADQLVPEPVAAATFYASQRPLDPGSVIAVYDLGGGTFDASLVRAGTEDFENFEIVGQPDGIERLGGIDFDHAVLRYACQAADVDLDALDPDDPGLTAALTQMREHCVLAKESLSAETAASIPVALPGVYTEVRLTRTEFEDMIRPALDETLVALRRTIASAQLATADVTAVLLVGGSSRIPLVAQMVTAGLGLPIAVDARPKDAIALGAALTASEHSRAAVAAPVPPVPSPPVSSALPIPVPDRRPPPPSSPQASELGEGRRPAHRPRRPGRRRLGAALLTSAITVTGVLAWRTATDGASAPDVTVDTGTSHACALLQGTVECWGATAGQTSAPEETDFTAISAGFSHTCGIHPDQTVDCWGDDDEQQASPPAAERFTAVAAGENHTCGIHPDQSVECWGAGGEGQRTPQEGQRYTTLSSGMDFTCGILTDDTIACWGTQYGRVTEAPDGTFVALAAGTQHACAIRTDDTVDCWGFGGGDEAQDPTRPPEGEWFTSISAGTSHSCGIRSDRTVVCWGSNRDGQSTPPEGRFVSISAGGNHTCGVRPDESVDCWGDLGDPPAMSG